MTEKMNSQRSNGRKILGSCFLLLVVYYVWRWGSEPFSYQLFENSDLVRFFKTGRNIKKSYHGSYWIVAQSHFYDLIPGKLLTLIALGGLILGYIRSFMLADTILSRLFLVVGGVLILPCFMAFMGSIALFIPVIIVFGVLFLLFNYIKNGTLSK
jgi:hypothetical protein